MQITIDETLIRTLPLPLAELYHSVQRPYRKPLEQFLSTCQLWESGLKLLGAMAIAEYARLDHKDPQIQKRLTNLARPALGHWWEFVKTLLPVLAQANPERFQPMKKLLLDATIHDMPQAAALDVALQQEHDAKQISPRNTVRLKDLFDRMIWLRNQEVGHGALGQRKGSFYAQMSQKLLQGIVEVLARLDVLTGRHLIYISDVRRLPSGQWSIDRYELTGESGRILDSLCRPGADLAALPCPGQIYLQDAGSASPPIISLHPVVIFDPDEQEVMFLNERRGRGRLEYLCYSSGRTVDLKEVEQQELLSRLLDMEVDTSRLAEWAKKAEDEAHQEEEAEAPNAEAATPSPATDKPAPAPRPPLELELSPSPVITATPQGAPTIAMGTAIPLGKPIPVATLVPSSSPSALPPLSSPGRRLGDFELLSILGEGGMGVVYRARQVSLGRQVALKCLHPGGNKDRFAREIRALGRVKHPNLVEIFTSGSDGEQWFYAMELLDGATLSSVCTQLESHIPTASELTLRTWDESVKSACEKSRRSEKSLSSGSKTIVLNPTAIGGSNHGRGGTNPDLARDVPERPLAKLTGKDYIRRVVELVCQVADALQSLHKINVIHRDVKPSNIMVTPDGSHAVLMDLGLAKLVDASRGDLTQSRQFVGTLRYASPEQVHFAETIDARTDIYSLGATLWELLTFQPMHGATEHTAPFEVEKRILYAQPKSASKHNRTVPPDLDAIISKCLEKDPQDRYRSAQALSGDLHRFLRGEPIETSKKTLGRRVQDLGRSVRMHRAVVGTGLVVAVLMIVVGFLVFRPAVQAPPFQVETFAHFTKRFGAPQGIVPLTEDQAAQRNYCYKLLSRGGRVEKIEVVNGRGKPTARHDFGALLNGPDTVDRDCCYEFKYDGDGNVSAEIAYDRAGDVIWKFTYTSVNDKFKTAGYFTDKDGNVRPRTTSGATRLTFVWNEKGYLAEVRYFDVQNRPQPDREGGFGIRFERDDKGQSVQTTQLDSDGKASLNRSGYCKIKNRHDDRANLVEATMFDTKDEPTRHWQGYGRRKLEYDDHGNQISQTYWTPDGKPAWHADGYHRMARKYDANGLEIEIAYFGDDGKPVARKGGYHRAEYVNNEFDDAIECTFYGVDNRITRHKDGNSGWTAKFDKHGQRTEVNYLDENRKPVLHMDGNHGWRAELDGRGNQTKISFVDAAGKLVCIFHGYAYRESTFDDYGNCTSTSYFDDQGKPSRLTSDTYAKVVRKFDDRGNNIEETYFDDTGKPVKRKDGYVKVVTKFDEHGLVLSYAYFDEDNRPTRSIAAASHKVLHKRDLLGHLIERRWVDENDKIYPANGLYETYFNDAWGNVLELTWRTADGQLRTQGGAAKRMAVYDEHGLRLQETYFDHLGNMNVVLGGYARMNSTYDRHGNVLEKAYFDAFANPVRHRDGYFKISQTYDAFDNLVRVIYLNAQSTPLRQDSGIASYGYEYDRWNNKIALNYFDELNRPVRHRTVGITGWRSKHDAFGNTIERWFVNEEGRPTICNDGNAKWAAKYDRFNQMTEVRYLDDKDKLVRLTPLDYAHGKWVYEKNRCVDASFFDENDQPLAGRVVVKSMTAKGLAERLGIKANDVLFSYRGTELHFAGKFRTLRANKAAAGNELMVYRAGTFLTMQLPPVEAEGWELEERAGPPIRRMRFREDD